MNNPTPNQLEWYHVCVVCDKKWECPQGKECKSQVTIMCSKCFNTAKKEHLFTEFGECQQDD